MECVSSFVGTSVQRIMDRVLDAGGRQLGYIFHDNDNIETLKKEAKKLAGRRKSEQGRIVAAERNLEIIEIEVSDWIKEVDQICAETENFLKDEAKADKRCLKGWCINPGSRRRFSKEAKQRTLDISRLHQDGEFQTVSRPAPQWGNIVPSSKVFSGTIESRQLIMNQIMEGLKDEEVSIIGICGMAGAGKTTLVNEIATYVEKDKLSDVVVMAVVSQTPNILKIQQGIAKVLGLTLSGDDELARARSLWERIQKEKRILIILDDVLKKN